MDRERIADLIEKGIEEYTRGRVTLIFNRDCYLSIADRIIAEEGKVKLPPKLEVEEVPHKYNTTSWWYNKALDDVAKLNAVQPQQPKLPILGEITDIISDGFGNEIVITDGKQYIGQKKCFKEIANAILDYLKAKEE